MPLYPLGISRRRDLPSVPRQAAGSVEVRWSLAGELACAFIDAPHEAVPPMLHATVLDAIHRRICVLPVRFGVALGDETEIHSLLQARRRELLGNLSRLDWTCEMGVRITPLSSPSGSGAGGEGHLHAKHPHPSPLPKGEGTDSKTTASPGGQSPRAYLDERRSHYQRADEDAEQDQGIVRQFVERMHDCYRRWLKLPPSPSSPVRLAFLVERSRVTAFRSRAEEARKACGQRRCAVLGPWPPYSFVESFPEHLHADVGAQ